MADLLDELLGPFLRSSAGPRLGPQCLRFRRAMTSPAKLPGVLLDNCPSCEGTGYVIDFAAIRARTIKPKPAEWSGSPDPNDPDNYWIDDKTGERVNAQTGERRA